MRLKSLLAACLVSSPAFAVQTTHWTHSSEADFNKGTFQHVVASNLGDLKLSRAVETILEQDPRVSAITALVEAPDGTVYAGTQPDGVLLSLRNGKVETAATLEDGAQILSLLVTSDGRLLIGTGGDRGRILAREGPDAEPKELFSHEDVQYVWGMKQARDGTIYAATGPNGQLVELKPDGASRVLFDAKEHNLLSLLLKDDTLYAGTDPNGLVYRIDRKSGDVFVLYDAPESEVTALAMDARDNLFAGTGQAIDGEAAEEDAGEATQVGRPERQTTGVEIEAGTEEPEEPEEPENPDQPDPQPKAAAEELQDSGDGEEAPDDGEGDEQDPGAPEDGEDGEEAPADPAEAVEKIQEMLGRTPGGAGEDQPQPEGNAIYRIDRDGFVTEIFRQPVVVLSMVERDGVLLVGTGNEGMVYQVDPAAEETLVLAKVEPKQVLSLLPLKSGNLLLGMANVGSIAEMSGGYATSGTYTSPVLDATQVSRFGNLRLHGTLPEGTAVTVATRSGNVEEPGEAGWSQWSADVPAARFVTVASPPGRFLQYRLTLTSEEGKKTPVVEDVDVAYQVPNLAPQVSSVTVGADAQAQASPAAAPPGVSAGAAQNGTGTQTISWTARDPNTDALKYDLYFRSDSRAPWILLKEGLSETQFEWKTQTVADGRYEIKVVASDAAANPRGTGRTASRVSDPVLVDNTAPLLRDVRAETDGGEVAIELTGSDRTSTIAAVEYAVDSADDWQAVVPSDNIFDGPEERVSFRVSGLSAGPHQITLRATDARGNRAYETLLVEVEGPTAGK